MNPRVRKSESVPYLGVVSHVVAVDGKLDGVADKEEDHDGHQGKHSLLRGGNCCCYGLKM